MSIDLQRIEANGRQWDFSLGAPHVPVSAAELDLGYEAAQPGLQALYAEAAEAGAQASGPVDD